MTIFSDAVVQTSIGDLLKATLNTEDSLERWLSQPPLFTVLRVNTLKCKIDEARIIIEQHLHQQYTARNKPPPLVSKHSQIPDALVIQSSGPCKVEPVIEKEVIVGSLCGCAVLRGADVFAPGVIGAPSSMQAGDIVSVYADIRNKCLRGSTQPFKSDRVFVGNGRAIQSRDQIFKSSVAKGVAIEMIDSLFDCPSFNHLVQRGIGMLQNLPSVLASHVLDPSPGDCVLDACAAPGGKSTHLATLVGPKGLVFALDKSQNKIEQIIANCLRLGLGNVRCFVQDASTCLLDEKNDLKTTQKPPFPLETFDKILLDAPCSGLGQRPQFINNIGNKELASFPKLQKKIFSTMVKLLKPGGTLVYSTCTFSIEENEEIVLWAISSFQELTLIDSEPRIGQSGIQIEGMTETMAKKVQRFFVSPRDENIKNCDNDTIGFFIAKFCKR